MSQTSYNQNPITSTHETVVEVQPAEVEAMCNTQKDVVIQHRRAAGNLVATRACQVATCIFPMYLGDPVFFLVLKSLENDHFCLWRCVRLAVGLF